MEETIRKETRSRALNTMYS